MRLWVIAAAGAGGALLIDLLVIRPLSASAATLAVAGLSIYTILVLLMSTAAFIVELRRIRIRLEKSTQTVDEWNSAFVGTGLERLSHRLLDLVFPDDPGDPHALVVQSCHDPGQVRREVRVLFWGWLMRAQFFTAFALVLAICGLSALQPYAPVLIVILVITALCALAVQGAAGAFLDAITQMPTERIEVRLLRALTDLTECVSKSQSIPSAALVPRTAFDPASERLGVVLEDLMGSLRNSMDRLAASADLLASAASALSDREASDAALLRDSRAVDQIKVVVEELTAAIDRLPLPAQGLSAATGAPAGGCSANEKETTPDADLGREVRKLLKEFE